jgi:diacylglycerol kinase (ATP)
LAALTSRGVVLVNPAAANGATARRWPRIHTTLRSRGLDFTVLLSPAPGQAGRAAREAVDAGASWMLVVGGDGTFNEVINGLADEGGRVPEDLVLGFIPSGTGLDLARSLGIPTRAEEAARVIGRQVRRIDLGLVRWEDGRRRLFANMVGAGFDAEVAERSIPLRRLIPGRLAYALGIFTTLPGHEPRVFEARVGPAGNVMHVPGLMAVCCNGPSYGGGMRLTPDAVLNDGMLDLFLLEEVSRLRFLIRIPLTYRGAHVSLPQVHLIRTESVWLSADRPTPVQTDGEPAGWLPITVESVSDALSVLT